MPTFSPSGHGLALEECVAGDGCAKLNARRLFVHANLPNSPEGLVLFFTSARAVLLVSAPVLFVCVSVPNLAQASIYMERCADHDDGAPSASNDSCTCRAVQVKQADGASEHEGRVQVRLHQQRVLAVEP